MFRNLASNALTLAIVLLVAVAGYLGWAHSQFTSEGPLETPIFFEVKRGASLRSVSEELAAAGAIQSATIFRLGADYTDRSGALKFGNYEIPAHASMEQILEILTRGGRSTYRYIANYVIRNDASGELRLVERDPASGNASVVARYVAGEGEMPEIYAVLVEQKTPVAYRVIVPEGLTSWQVVEALKGADFLGGDIREVPAEGSLAPDSYEVTRGNTRQELIDKMQASQARILAEAWENRAPDLPISTPEEALILASIVEKETGQPEERGQVASVFVNRLEQGMKLQTDPTVIYGITKGQGILGRGIRQSELRRETPWNTYVIKGLPPTPIANPGKAAIEAALNPDDTTYVFFVADGTGGHAFATTLAEHNRNVAKWRKIERERQQSGE